MCLWKGTSEELELFAWHFNGFEYVVHFILQVEKEGFLPFWMLESRIRTENLQETHTQQYVNWN